MKTSLFSYDLPDSFIANEPVEPRDHSKLLVFDTSKNKIYHEIAEFLSEKDLLVLNRSRVIPARVKFFDDGKEREIFILRNLGNFVYEVLVRPGRFFRPGKIVEFGGGRRVEVLSMNVDGSRQVLSNFELECMGSAPLPPYVKNQKIDFERYQTVYSKDEGSVAAPTAGLHFTRDLISNLKTKGIDFAQVVLHVGLGTFLPVKVDNVEDHFMHKEFYSLEKEAADAILSAKNCRNRVIAVGSTSVRVVETAFKDVPFKLSGETDIFIRPGAHDWKIVDGMITNFHLPKSSLMMMVASFLESKGVKDPVNRLLGLYELAKSENYRFYSFGDAMFIF